MTTEINDHDECVPHSCQYCQSTTIHISHNISDGDSFTEQGTLDITCGQARRAAADGCKLFGYLMRSAPSEREANDLIRYSFKYEYLTTEASSIHFQYPAHSRVLEVYAGDAETLADFWPPPNLAPASASSVMEASRWLAHCVEEHPACAKVDDVFVPPRLLRVTCAQNEALLVKMDVKKPVPYAVLSYCWGGNQVFKTVKSNVDKASRALEELPQTIRDAIHVTRQLGLDYLWVDSMCIIQDSVEDKSALISQMHKIYACAHVTIAASKASACTEGFLAPRTTVPQFRIPIIWSKGNGDSGRLSNVILILSPQRSVEPLATRAWTLQESLLSRRILSYGDRQPSWYCAQMERCDGGVINLDSASFASFRSLEDTVIHLPRRRLKAKLVPKDLTSLPWVEIVEQYTQRNMSVTSDKLVAISAIAQRLDSMTNGKWGGYYGGIWSERFFEQLLWSLSSREIAERPAQYRAPSWSWAAVDGRPKWPWIEHLVDANISCELIGVETQPLRPGEPFGEVTMGKLQVLGKVKEAIWSADRRTIRDATTGDAVTDHKIETFPDHLEEDAHEVGVHILEVAKRSFLANTMDAFSIRRTSNSGKYVAGLVLQHLGDEIYQRVGFIGLRSVKVDTIVLAPDWSKVGNSEWWAQGFTKTTITIL